MYAVTEYKFKGPSISISSNNTYSTVLSEHVREGVH